MNPEFIVTYAEGVSSLIILNKITYQLFDEFKWNKKLLN